MGASLAWTSLVMGLVGGPHCVVMCGAACAAVGASDAGDPVRGERAAVVRGIGAGAMLRFQLGRLLGYSLLGAVAASSVQAVGWLSTQTVVLRPVWTLLHVAAMGLGGLLLCTARQPAWLEQAGRAMWSVARRRGLAQRGRGAVLMGVLWAFMPCGLLYSAVLVAALTGNVPGGAGVMALFALGSGVSMLLGPALWQRLRLRRGGSGDWGVRLAGAMLLGSSFATLWMGLVHATAPWCVTPA